MSGLKNVNKEELPGKTKSNAVCHQGKHLLSLTNITIKFSILNSKW